MKVLSALIIVITLSGCAGRWVTPKAYSPEIAYKCQTDQYSPDCLQPPAVFKN